MSSSNVQLILTELTATRADVLALKAEVSSLRAALATKNAAAAASSSSVGKPVAEKKQRKKSDAPPTAWRLFSDRVRGVLTAAGFKGKALGVECVQFAASLKDENADFGSWTDDLILARRADWSPPAISRGEAKHGKGWAKTGERRAASKNGSVVSGGDEELDGDAAPASSSSSGKPKKERKNPWAGLTPEQKAAKVAAMKAGRAAKKAADEGDLDDDVPEGTSASEIRAAADMMRATKTEQPPSPKVSNAAASSSTAVASSSGPEGFKKAILNDKPYWVNPANGHAYHRLKDQSQGEWAGLFVKTPKPHIDDSVPEPTADEDDALVLDE